MKKYLSFIVVILFLICFQAASSQDEDTPMIPLPDSVIQNYTPPDPPDEGDGPYDCHTIDYTCTTPYYYWHFGPGSSYNMDGFATRFTPTGAETLKTIDISFYSPANIGSPDVEVFVCRSENGIPNMTYIDYSIILPPASQTWPWHIYLVNDEGITLIYNSDFFIGVRLANPSPTDAAALISDGSFTCEFPVIDRSYLLYENNWMLAGNYFPNQYNWFISCQLCPGQINKYYVATTGNDITGDGSSLFPFATIQKGLDTANGFDSVLVAPGLYNGNGNRDLNFNGKNIILVATDGPEMTTIDCEGSTSQPHRGIYFHNGEIFAALVSGFKFINGYNGNGGSILIENASPTITNCIFENNTATDLFYSGGAILLYLSNSLISDCIFNNNTALKGGGLTLLESNCTISDCLIKNNTANSEGGGGFFSYGGNPNITGCTIVFNDGGNWGGGIFVRDGASTIENCIIYGNFATNGSGVWCELSPVTITCSNIYNNIVEGTEAFISNSISLDPLFCDEANNDYRIKLNSPCRPAFNSCNVLMGALDERCFDRDVWHVSVTGDNLTANGSESDPFATIQLGVIYAENGDTVLVHDGTYTGDGNRDITVGDFGITILSENGPETTIIDCQGSMVDYHRAFNFVSGNFAGVIVSGFTIQNGYAQDGGAIYGYEARPKIRNNIFQNNYSFIGGAINCDQCDNVSIENNVLRNNTAGSGQGGAIYTSQSHTYIGNNLFSDNAVYIYGIPIGSGSAIYCNDITTIEYNLIIDNINATAIHCLSGDVSIYNNTICGNSNGAVMVEEANVTFVRNIIAYNLGDGPIQSYGDPGNTYFGYNDIYNNNMGDWIGIAEPFANQNGNFSSDPYFCDIDNDDYSISLFSQCSPAINQHSLIGAFDPACGDVWHVATDGDDITGDGNEINPFATIQHAINLSGSGDSIKVHEGTFSGVGNWGLDYLGKNIIVKSVGGPEQTIIDMLNTPSVNAVTFENEEDTTAVFEGFTIINGVDNVINCSGGSPTIRGNIFRDNDLCCLSAFPNIGAVIACGFQSYDIGANPIIEDNFIYVNDGFGISLLNGTGGRTTRNWIEGSKGIGIWAIDCSARIENNIVKGFQTINECGCGGNIPGPGVGIKIKDSQHPEIIDAPIVKNNTIVDVKYGIWIYNESRPITVTNNIISDATCVTLSIYAGLEPINNIIECNNFFNISNDCTHSYLDTASYFIGTDGNISKSPLFCDAGAGDYHISSNSFCAPSNNECNELIGALGIGCSNNYSCGDIDLNDEVTVTDIIFLINYYFLNGPAPESEYTGDINCDGKVSLADLVYLSQYVLHNGTADCCP